MVAGRGASGVRGGCAVARSVRTSRENDVAMTHT
jgi:hypothetical protein